MSPMRASSNARHERALDGLRIVLTRPREQAGDFEQVVGALGGRPEVAPAIAIAPPADWRELDSALDLIEEFDWIAFTSANAVSALAARALARGMSSSRFATVKLGAVGSATATAVAAEFRVPDAIAASTSAAGLGEELPVTPGQRVLVPHGDLADGTLVDALRRRGAQPASVVVYRTVPGEGIPSIVAGLREGTIDALLFTSGSAVRYVAEALAAGDERVSTAKQDIQSAIFCIGPSTARVAISAGFAPDGIATAATQRSLIDEVVRWFAARSGSA